MVGGKLHASPVDVIQHSCLIVCSYDVHNQSMHNMIRGVFTLVRCLHPALGTTLRYKQPGFDEYKSLANSAACDIAVVTMQHCSSRIFVMH